MGKPLLDHKRSDVDNHRYAYDGPPDANRPHSCEFRDWNDGRRSQKCSASSPRGSGRGHRFREESRAWIAPIYCSPLTFYPSSPNFAVRTNDNTPSNLTSLKTVAEHSSGHTSCMGLHRPQGVCQEEPCNRLLLPSQWSAPTSCVPPRAPYTPHSCSM